MWRAQRGGRASGAGEAMPPPPQGCAARAAWATAAPRQTRFLRQRGWNAVQQRARWAARRGGRRRRATAVMASRRAGFWRLLRSRRGGRTCCGRSGAATGPATRPTALRARAVAPPHAAGAADMVVGGRAGRRARGEPPAARSRSRAARRPTTSARSGRPPRNGARLAEPSLAGDMRRGCRRRDGRRGGVTAGRWQIAASGYTRSAKWCATAGASNRPPSQPREPPGAAPSANVLAVARGEGESAA